MLIILLFDTPTAQKVRIVPREGRKFRWSVGTSARKRNDRALRKLMEYQHALQVALPAVMSSAAKPRDDSQVLSVASCDLRGVGYGSHSCSHARTTTRDQRSVRSFIALDLHEDLVT